MPPPKKRLPGQSNADYQGRIDPNAEFIGTQSLFGGGDLSFVHRGLRAFLARLDQRPGRTSR